jgi:hypothetical protein
LKDEKGRSTLSLAVARNAPPELISKMIEKGLNVNQLDSVSLSISSQVTIANAFPQ